MPGRNRRIFDFGRAQQQGQSFFDIESTGERVRYLRDLIGVDAEVVAIPPEVPFELCIGRRPGGPAPLVIIPSRIYDALYVHCLAGGFSDRDSMIMANGVTESIRSLPVEITLEMLDINVVPETALLVKIKPARLNSRDRFTLLIHALATSNIIDTAPQEISPAEYLLSEAETDNVAHELVQCVKRDERTLFNELAVTNGWPAEKLDEIWDGVRKLLHLDKKEKPS